MPAIIEATAHNGSAYGKQVLSPGAIPAHARAIEARLELLGCAFDHAAADEPLAFAQFLIAHTVLVVAEVSSLFLQLLSDVRLFFSSVT